MTLGFHNSGPFQVLYDFAWDMEEGQSILWKVPPAMPKCDSLISFLSCQGNECFIPLTQSPVTYSSDRSISSREISSSI